MNQSICKHCGDTIHHFPSHPRKYCNRRCMGEHYAREKAHAYMGNKRRLIQRGYIAVRVDEDHPMREMAFNRSGAVLEHRLAMALSLGRPLHQWETVHHINGQRGDNRVTNLQLRIGSHGQGQAYQCADCGSHRVSPVALPEAA